MRANTHVVAVAGSLRDDSGTRIALREALAAAEAVGATTELVDLREYDLPPLDADAGAVGDAPALTERIRAADAVLLGTPMYHGSYSSVLKTALDYCTFEEFEDTTVGLLAVSGGSFPTPALAHLRAVARALNAWTLPLQVGIPDAHEAFDDGALADESLAERARRLGVEAVEYAGVAQYPEVVHGAAEPVRGD